MSQRPSVDAAVLASRVPYRSGLYVLGPFAERVSFASQQRRAMNLAWSIHQDLLKSGDDRGLKAKKVVVVGAGLGGLTSAVALRLFGALVTVLDRQDKVFGEMATAAHRDIHPTINFWPIEDFAVSTNFPFLNWYQDSCDNILQRFYAEWTDFQVKKNIIGPNMQCEVTAIDKLPDGSWSLKVEQADDDDYVSIHDIVVLATGFGRERDLTDADPGYWDFDFDPIRHIQAENIDPFVHYVISGTGDGGLIEALRLLFSSFRAGEIDDAMIPLINEDELGNIIRGIEADVRQHVLDAILHEGAELSESFKNDISAKLWEKYSESVRLWIGPGAKRELEQKRSKIGHVVLIGRRPSPLEYGAAPYHRLLITLCILSGWVTYHQVAQTDLSDARLSYLIPDSGKSVSGKRVEIKVTHTIAARTDDKFDPAETLVFDNSLFLRRHGATTPIDALFADPADQERIRRVQALYADQDWLSMEQLTDYAKLVGLQPPYDLKGWANGLSSLATDYFAKRHGLDVEFTDTTGQGEFILYRDGPHFDRVLFAKNVRRIPDRFLQIDVSKRIERFRAATDDSGFDA